MIRSKSIKINIGLIVILFLIALEGCSTSSAVLSVSKGASDDMTAYSLYQAPMKPHPLKRIVTESEPIRSLIIALPLRVLREESMANFFLDIIIHASRYVNVIILYKQTEPETISYIINALNDIPGSPDLLSKLEFYPARFNTRWIRDYGPIFAFDRQGNLCLIDSIYRDVRKEEFGQKRKEDDIAPVYIAQLLRKTYQDKVKIVRTPLQLWGGDFFADGKGNVFISTETLIMGGGRKDEVDKIFRNYFAAKNVIYLEPLPGQTMKHLDMFLKVLDENTIMIAEYKKDYRCEGTYNCYLHEQAKKVLENNLEILEEKFRDKRIIKVPIPSIIFQTREEIVKRIRAKLLAEKMLALFIKDPHLQEVYESSILGKELVEKEILDICYEELKVQSGSLTEEEFIDRLMKLYHNVSLEEAIKNYFNSECIYRTYLNSIYICDGSNDGLFLVPRYKPQSAEEKIELTAMEKEVENKYKEAKPGAKVIWIDSDSIIKEKGAIHCVTIAVPRFVN